MYKKITTFATQHKITAGILAVVIIFAGYKIVQSFTGSAQATAYTLAAVERGTLVVSVSGSGQVSTVSQVDVKAKASGVVWRVGVKEGQSVKAGAFLAQLDNSDAAKNVRNARLSLESSQIQLQKLKSSQVTSIPKIQDNITTATNNLTQSYEDGFGDVSDAFLNMPTIISAIRGVIYDATVGEPGQLNSGAYKDLIDKYQSSAFTALINRLEGDYSAAYIAYTANSTDYSNSSRDSDADLISSLIDTTLNTTRLMSKAAQEEAYILDTLVKSMKQYQAGRLIPTAIIQYQSNVGGYISQLDSIISSLVHSRNSISDAKQSIASLNRDLAAASQNDPLDVASQENTIKQRQAALADAQSTLGDYTVRAPFAGVIAKLNVQKGLDVSSGGTIATIITTQKEADIALNEVDVAKIGIGQKATLTFDAIPGLSLTGQVNSIDSIGTVAQGVVTYTAKIIFDSQDDRVKSGMSVSAAIITQVKMDALIVPNSAVKTQGGSSFVQIPVDQSGARTLMGNISGSTGVGLPAAPRQQTIEKGASNDTSTEVTSGLQEGDIIITRTISSATAKISTAPSLFGGGGAVGGSTRTLGR